MKSHRHLLNALLAGETLQHVNDHTRTVRLEDNHLSLFGFNDYNKLFIEFGAWEIKPKTININGFEVPEPIRECPPSTRNVYVVDFSYPGNIKEYYIDDDNFDVYWYSNGLVHLTKENALLHANALLSFFKLS